jgi:hypothetical protein
MDHRPERRRPRRTHGITPTPTARPPLPPDQLAAAARTPLLVRVETVATDLSDDRLRAIERSQFLRRVNVDVPRATPATGTGLDVDERQLLRPVTKSDARSPSPAAPTWVACDPTPARLLPGCHRDQETRSQIDYFSCGAVRSRASLSPCTGRFSALLRPLPSEWRRRESNPRPRPHRTERLRA